MSLIKTLKLKDNIFRSVVISLVISLLPIFYGGGFKGLMSIFLIVVTGCIIGNLVYDLIKYIIEVRKFNKAVKGGLEKHG